MPTPPPSVLRRAARLRAGAGLALAVVALLAVLLAPTLRPGAAGARGRVPAQTDPVSTITTTEDLLDGATTTATSAPTSTTAPKESVQDAQSSADADTRRVWFIVGALLVVAFLLLVLTIGYWRHTRPSKVQVAPTPRHAKGAKRGGVPADEQSDGKAADGKAAEAVPPAAVTPDADEASGRRGRRARRRSDRPE